MAKNLEDVGKLEQAIHYLKEAQQLEEYGDNAMAITARAKMVDKAIGCISDFVEKEKENAPFEVNTGP